jgi:thiol-disulfide isomerase/thioredoxin
VSCKKELPKKELPEKSIPKQATNTKIATFNYEKLKPLLHLKDDKIYVVNFWATWCAPCVKELPYFERLGKLYKEKNVEVLLVSLDFPKKIESKLIPFLEKKGIKSKVVLLDDTNEQFWIRDISEDWSGALPGTLIYNKDKRAFYEKSFTYESLEQTVQTFLN